MAVDSSWSATGRLATDAAAGKNPGVQDDSRDAMTVLVADDDAGSLLVAKAAVEKYGHECIVAADGETAWQLF